MNIEGWRKGWLARWHITPLLPILLVALIVRVALWDNLPRTGMISDEAEYLAAADWLAQGRGFAWHREWLWTRAPLYIIFLAWHIQRFGLQTTPIYITQTILSLLNVILVYVLALRLRPAYHPTPPPGSLIHEADESRGGRPWSAMLAALLMAIYLPFAIYPQIILSETLYQTLLLSAFVALALRHRGTWLIALAGGLLGLATLTRGLTLGFLPLVALWVGWTTAERRLPTAIGAMSTFTATCCLVILPWSLYASRLYGGPVLVDTTGAYNLLLGARAAYDGQRRDAPSRNFVLALLNERLTPDERQALLNDTCLWQNNDPRLQDALHQPVATITQSQRQRLMVAEGMCLIRTKPGAFVIKSLKELLDFFQINYTGAERMSSGFTLGRLPRWYTLALFVLDDTLYALAVPLAAIGYGRALRAARRATAACLSTQRHNDTTMQRCNGATVQQYAVNRTSSGVKLIMHGAVLPPPRLRASPLPRILGLVGLWWLYNVLTAPLLFAINRFRLPLLPFVFIFAAYALSVRCETRDVRRRAPCWQSAFSGWAFVIGLLLALAVWTPYAYLQPPPATLASYLGPYPSSLVSTIIAWNERPAYIREQQLRTALGAGDAAATRSLLETSDFPPHIQAIAWPLLLALEGQPAAGLAQLDQQANTPLTDWQAAVVRGDLLRHMGELDAARHALSPTFVDNHNPVEWAWQWLHPAPLANNHIDLGGDLDLGYIRGFYLGEGEAGVGTFRWSTAEAHLRFPQAGNAGKQQFCMRADGRGWPNDLGAPRLRLITGQQVFAHITLERDVLVYCAALPASVPAGADIVITIHSDIFTPEADDLLTQQGVQAGQLRLLGVRIDWAEVRPVSGTFPVTGDRRQGAGDS